MAAGRDYLADFRIVVIEIDAYDLIVRNHDIVDRYLLEVEDADQHLAIAARDARAGLEYDGAEFLSSQRLQLGAALADAEKPQDAVRGSVRQPHDRVSDLEQRVVDQRCGEGETLGVQCGERLGCRLREDDHDEREDAGADRNRRFAAEVQCDQGHERGGREVDQVVAKQDQPDQPIGAFEQLFRESRTTVAVTCLVPQLIAVEAHECCLGAGEEGRQQQ